MLKQQSVFLSVCADVAVVRVRITEVAAERQQSMISFDVTLRRLPAICGGTGIRGNSLEHAAADGDKPVTDSGAPTHPAHHSAAGDS